jgi:hypothetical protein
MGAVVASFSGQNVAVNSSVKSCQDAKHIFPDPSSCHKMCSYGGGIRGSRL